MRLRCVWQLDVHHWWATGGLLDELVKLALTDVVYVGSLTEITLGS